MSQQNAAINRVLAGSGAVILSEHILGHTLARSGLCQQQQRSAEWPHGGRVGGSSGALPHSFYPCRMGKADTGGTAVVLTALSVPQLPVL